jgi:hypothetical protein
MATGGPMVVSDRVRLLGHRVVTTRHWQELDLRSRLCRVTCLTLRQVPDHPFR